MNLFTRHFFFYALVILIALAWDTSARACKYTVRDIGFTDLGPTGYRLYFYYDDTTPEEIVAGFKRLAYAAYLDANVETEIIHINRQADHPAMTYLQQKKIPSLPAVILASPDDNGLVLPFSYTNENRNESMWQLIESVVVSPMRSRIINVLKNGYGVVLLIKGTNGENNRLAEQAITGAIKDVSRVLTLMPKPIEQPPQMLVLSRKASLKEEVLLWSLKAGVTEQAQAAVLYGRGRRIGPTLVGQKITQENIFSLLATIGADCECGLDRSVMLGKMIPLRWEKEIQSELNEQLGFDVENPLIKMEMSQILSISPALQQGKNAKNPLSAYKEGIVKFAPASSQLTVSSGRFRASTPAGSNPTDHFMIRLLLYSTGGILMIVLFIGYFVFVRARKR